MPNGNTPVSSSSNNKWYAIAAIIAVAVLALWLVPRFMRSATGVNVDQHMNGATTYTNDQGSVTVGAAAMPENWPSDAPANYAGATIVYSGTSNPQTGTPGSAVSYTAQASVQAVADYYKQQLSAAGWTVLGAANVGSAMVVSAKKDTRTMGVYITDTGDGHVSVVAGIGM